MNEPEMRFCKCGGCKTGAYGDFCADCRASGCTVGGRCHAMHNRIPEALRAVGLVSHEWHSAARRGGGYGLPVTVLVHTSGCEVVMASTYEETAQRAKEALAKRGDDGQGT